MGYLPELDLSSMGEWDVTEMTEAEALTFSQQFYAEAEVTADGRISNAPPPDLED